jgi:hypothetical protein
MYRTQRLSSIGDPRTLRFRYPIRLRAYFVRAAFTSQALHRLMSQALNVVAIEAER